MEEFLITIGAMTLVLVIDGAIIAALFLVPVGCVMLLSRLTRKLFRKNTLP